MHMKSGHTVKIEHERAKGKANFRLVPFIMKIAIYIIVAFHNHFMLMHCVHRGDILNVISTVA